MAERFKHGKKVGFCFFFLCLAGDIVAAREERLTQMTKAVARVGLGEGL